VRVEGPFLLILDTSLLLHDHSDICQYCYHETSINKTEKLHVLLTTVLEIENVIAYAKASNF